MSKNVKMMSNQFHGFNVKMNLRYEEDNQRTVASCNNGYTLQEIAWNDCNILLQVDLLYMGRASFL